MNNLKEQLQQDIVSYFEGYLEPPFTYTSEDKETMVDDLCELVGITCEVLSAAYSAPNPTQLSGADEAARREASK